MLGPTSSTSSTSVAAAAAASAASGYKRRYVDHARFPLSGWIFPCAKCGQPTFYTKANDCGVPRSSYVCRSCLRAASAECIGRMLRPAGGTRKVMPAS